MMNVQGRRRASRRGNELERVRGFGRGTSVCHRAKELRTIDGAMETEIREEVILLFKSEMMVTRD